MFCRSQSKDCPGGRTGGGATVVVVTGPMVSTGPVLTGGGLVVVGTVVVGVGGTVVVVGVLVAGGGTVVGVPVAGLLGVTAATSAMPPWYAASHALTRRR